MQKLLEYGVPELIVQLVSQWYSNQKVSVRYMSYYSKMWAIGNGIRQGGILSSLFFNIYIDSLISSISKMNIGCKLGILNSSIIAYADDIALFSPSVKSLQHLIDDVARQGVLLDLTFNLKKTKCMIFRSGKRTTTNAVVSGFRINNGPIEFVNVFRYLGDLITPDLNDDSDICRVRSKFYSEFNSMLRNFNFTDSKVKIFLFKQYCLQLYGSELWCDSQHSALPFKQFEVGYHKAIKKILNLSYHESNHYACQEAQVFTFYHYINKLKIMNALRILSKPCHFISKLKDFFRLSSVFINHVYGILDRVYQLDSLLLNDRDAIISRICFVQNHEKQMRTQC